MELSTTPSWTVNCSILLTGHPLLRRPQAARDAGFGAVEFWWPFDRAVPGDREVGAFVAAVRDAGVVLSHLNMAAGDLAAGERGLLSDPRRSSEFLDAVDVAVGIGAQLGTVGFNALYGNRLDGVAPAAQDDLAARCLAHAGRAAAAVGAVVLVEPVSAVPDYPLRTAGDVVTVLDRVHDEHGVDSLRLLADLYHLAVNGDDVETVIDRRAGRIGHVQVADAPGRGAPGTGRLPLGPWLDRLAARGYGGHVALEYRSDAAEPFTWMPAGR